jgi:hypothetical protein
MKCCLSTVICVKILHIVDFIRIWTKFLTICSMNLLSTAHVYDLSLVGKTALRGVDCSEHARDSGLVIDLSLKNS